jgi:hypothetical protein
MKRHLILTGLLFLVSHAVIFSQQYVYITGKVIDSKTSEPVSFAALHLKDAQFGIYSNADGDFRILNVPGFQTDSLIVTCIGYKRRSVAFSSLKASKSNNIKLVPNIRGLNEVTVIARKNRMNSEAIVARAIRNIKKNNPDKPFSYVAYYRDYQKDSINYLNLNEAIIQTVDTGFASSSEYNIFRLLDFKKNMDFKRMNMSPFYDLPETEHSDVWYKRVPNAIVGDQYGNEFFILLVHDAIRNFDKRSFSYVDTLAHNFIKNHIFSSPDGIYDGNNLLYKIDFRAKPQIIDNILLKGSIFIHPEDYSIYKLEYSASYLDSEKKSNEIFNIEIEYGHESAVNSKMCLKYISFNNSFGIPDSSDNDYFKAIKSEWRSAGGPYEVHRPTDMTIVTTFNKKIDHVSGNKIENYDITLGQRKAKITAIHIIGDTAVYFSIKDERFKTIELETCYVNVKNLKDINGNLINKRKELRFRQFRELFVQDYNKPLEFQNNCFIQYLPLDQNCISLCKTSKQFWMNTPLKTEEKKQESQNY